MASRLWAISLKPVPGQAVDGRLPGHYQLNVRYGVADTWWKTLLKQQRHNGRVRYSLMVSIKTEQTDVDFSLRN